MGMRVLDFTITMVCQVLHFADCRSKLPLKYKLIQTFIFTELVILRFNINSHVPQCNVTRELIFTNTVTELHDMQTMPGLKGQGRILSRTRLTCHRRTLTFTCNKTHDSLLKM